MKRIEIIVDPKGSTTVETKGFTGSTCTVASLFVEQALGKKSSERATPEFYAKPPVQVSENQHSG